MKYTCVRSGKNLIWDKGVKVSTATATKVTTPTGKSCPKLGSTAISSGMKYTCVRSGKNLIWDKGVKVKG
jgi:hypothetical protein